MLFLSVLLWITASEIWYNRSKDKKTEREDWVCGLYLHYCLRSLRRSPQYLPKIYDKVFVWVYSDRGGHADHGNINLIIWRRKE